MINTIENIPEILIENEGHVEKIEVGYTEENRGDLNFSSEDLTENKTKKQRLEDMYNEMAVENGYKSIEDFYVKKKFELAMKGKDYSKGDDYMNNLLKSIASDLGYGSSSKEFIMQNTLPKVSGKQAIMG